jgi:Mycobacterial 4 TMS phage holin, superfamily IV
MKSALVGVGVRLGSAAIGLLAVVLLLPEVSLRIGGLVIAICVFALAQTLAAPLVTKLSTRYAPALLSGIGLVSNLLALAVTTILGELSISGWRTWVLATMVIWLVTTLATVLLPLAFRRSSTNS